MNNANYSQPKNANVSFLLHLFDLKCIPKQVNHCRKEKKGNKNKYAKNQATKLRIKR